MNTLCYDCMWSISARTGHAPGAAHVAPDSFRSLTHKIPPNLGSTSHQASGDMECSHRHGFSLPISSLGSNDDELTTMTPTRALAIACTPKQSARHQAGALLPAAAAPSASPQTVRASVTPSHGPYIAWIRRGHSLFIDIPIGITQDYIRQ